MSSRRVVDQLAHLRQTIPDAHLVVFVPRSQIGQALETALARRIAGWHGVRATIPRHYAEEIAALDLLQSGKRENPVEGALFRAVQMLEALPASHTDRESLPGRHHLAGTVAEVVRTLREEGVSLDALMRHAHHPKTADTLRIVAACYASYLDALDDEGLYDDADVFRWARHRVAGEERGVPPDVPNTVYAVANALPVSGAEARFLDALQSAGRDFVRIGARSSSPPPPDRVAHRCPGVRLVEAPGSNGHDAQDRPGRPSFTRAVGAVNEVDAAFRDILRADVPFGDVAIAYVNAEPYATLIADRADAAGIPVTTATGLAATQSRSGRALRTLYEWIREDYDPALLVRMLRDGLLRVDRWLEQQDLTGDLADDGAFVYAHEAATLVAERSYEPGRDGLLKGLRSACQRLRSSETLRSAERIRLQKLGLVTAFVEDLLALLPRASDARTFARRCGRFLELFGPDDPPPKPQDESDRTLDEAARAVLWQRLDRLTRMPVDYTAPATRLASLFQKWLDGQFVQAEHPRPGAVHILPLESAGYDDRSHLYVVGLDSAGLSATPSENGLLRDADREALTKTSSPSRSRRLTAADELLWNVQQALARHQGPVAYYARTFNLHKGEACDPSAFFLARERDASSAEMSSDPDADPHIAGLVSDRDAPALLDREGWLRAYRDGKQRTPAPEAPTAQEAVVTDYPWLADGAAARAARQSDHYTAHDGLLPTGSYPELDLFGDEARAVSASRLQTLAETPYVYFLKYVLGVRPLDEPALEDEGWLNALRKGSLLHRTYEQFVRGLNGRVPDANDEARLHRILDEVMEEEVEQFAPSSDLVLEEARRTLLRHATVFFRAETMRDPAMQPDAFELGFGLPDRRQKAGDLDGDARVQIGGHTMPVSGRVDRIDRHAETGELSIWDYKTGSTSSLNETDPIQGGKTLQWALYAYAIESITGDTVRTSGYYFPTPSEMGTRIGFVPNQHRSEVEKVITALRDLTRTGTFPISPSLGDANAWKYNGYDRIVGDLKARKRELRGKQASYPDRPKPPSFG